MPRADSGAGGVNVTRAGCLTTICFDRPASRNALRRTDLDAAAQATVAAAADQSVRVLVVTGAGTSFSSGADTREPVTDHNGVADTGAIDAATEMVLAMTTMRKPVVAIVRGPAVGVAASIALSADIVVAGRSAFFASPQIRIGLHPDGGASALLPAAVGRARAMRMALMGDKISAAVAYDWGLISHLVDDDEVTATSDGIITELATGPTQAYAEAKVAINAQSIGGFAAALHHERAAQLALVGTGDFQEVVSALRERRRPVFRGLTDAAGQSEIMPPDHP